MSEHVDKDELEKLVGKDNARLAGKSPANMMSIIAFSAILKTSKGLDTLEHNHQNIENGKYESHTDTAEDGTMDIKNWKLGSRSFDSRAGGLIASFNSERSDMDDITDADVIKEQVKKLYRFSEWNS
jgi:hypothetical protein